ncbi:MAG: HAD-IC family P-type ATPase [Planctomycetaceae bacterium]|nr:HAD-IC family P-type ATPase [Planctomycetaceae bacterium]
MPPDEETPWHAMDLDLLFEQLKATPYGLSHEEVRGRLEVFGLNRLPEEPPATLWQVALRQFLSPLITILIIAAIVSVMIGKLEDAGFIALVLLLNAGIGTYQERKAEQSSRALKKLLEIRAAVNRNGETIEIPADQLVPGDIVLLESGNRVPADMRLLTVYSLEIDESLLTGESIAVEKSAAWNGDPQAPVGDRANMAWAGSIVARGRGSGLVVATGTATAVGKLSLDVVGAVSGKPPLLIRMEKFTNLISVATVSIAILIGLMGIVFGHFTVTEMFLFVVALTVAAIPEGLPVAMTVTLAIATTRMARRGLIVRRLTAVEGLGSCTLIATDKTGTLTVNELTVCVAELPDGTTLEVTGAGFVPEGTVLHAGQPVSWGMSSDLDRLARGCVLCNEAELTEKGGDWRWRGDSVDVALLAFGVKLGLHRPTILKAHPQNGQIPFESELQYAATYHTLDNKEFVIVKGAPERILAMCNLDSISADWESRAQSLASRGLRVLAVAEGMGTYSYENRNTPQQLTFLGFVGMIDPLRVGAKQAIEACYVSGVRVSMLTGDHAVTALAIARELGLADDESQVVTGAELVEATPEEMADYVQRIRVFARVAPRQKLEIVEAALNAGQFVAVTGDGVNDAPALRRASIGIAMGKSGTDVAREAAELVISDDNFTTIVSGIEEGRIAYDNIRKVIYLLISTGAAELVLMALSMMAGTPLPLLPVQILWLNLVTNGIQDVALAFEPGESDVLLRKPRPTNERILNRLMLERLIVAASVMGGISFMIFFWLLKQGWDEASARNVLLLVMVLFENFHIGNCRSETRSAFCLSPLKSPILLGGALGALLIHVLVMHLPFMQQILGTMPVALNVWIPIVLLASLVVPAMELHKLSWWFRFRD